MLKIVKKRREAKRESIASTCAPVVLSIIFFTIFLFPVLKINAISLLSNTCLFEETIGVVKNIWFDNDIIYIDDRPVLCANIEYKWNNESHHAYIESSNYGYVYESFLYGIYNKRKENASHRPEFINVYICKLAPNVFSLHNTVLIPSHPLIKFFLFLYFTLFTILFFVFSRHIFYRTHFRRHF